MQELAEDKQKVAEERVAYKKVVSEHAKKLEGSLLNNLLKKLKS